MGIIRREETIFAPATGTGGAISVIRVSGSKSISICENIFFPSDKNQRLADRKGFTIAYGDIRVGDEIIDDVLVNIFRAPHSYTGEDSIEIACHASSYIQRRILEVLSRLGAVPAQPGEFTQRAFMNGKMDLSQAEAVADLVASTTRSAHRVAINQMRGGFSAEIRKLRSELLNFASLIELELDFGEEDVEFADRMGLIQITTSAKNMADRLAKSFLMGNVIKNGIPVAIVGKPNSGKSTLLNVLLNEEKAIVSEIPGTTRDTIEDTLVIDGLEFRFIDTAGLRETEDLVEIMGIKKTHEKIDHASVIFLVDEVTDDPASINKRADSIRKMIRGTEKRLFLLINKADLSATEKLEELMKSIHTESNEVLLFISARDNIGLDKLRMNLSRIVEKDKLSSSDVIITNIRHYESLNNVSESLLRVEEGLKNSIPEDLIAIDIRQAIHFLGEITGEITTDELLGNIFRNFCIGK
jgi:tRNA modification GTPase